MPLSHSQTLEGYGYGGASGQIVRNHCQKRKIDFLANNQSNLLNFGDHKQFGESFNSPKRQCLWSQEEIQFQDMHQSHCQEPLQGCHKDMPCLSPATIASLSLSSSFVSASLPQYLTSSLSSCESSNNNLANQSLSCIRKEQERGQMSITSSDPPLQQNDHLAEEVIMEEDREFNSAVDIQNDPSIDNNRTNNSTSHIINSITESSDCFSNSYEVTDSHLSMESDHSSQYMTPNLLSNQASAPQNILRGTDRRGLKPSPVSGRLYCHCSASWRGMYGLEIGYVTDYY